MDEMKKMQYKVEQKTLNDLYKKLKQSVGFSEWALKSELKKTLYNRCMQQIFVKKDSIKLTYISRSDYSNHYGAGAFVNAVTDILVWDDIPNAQLSLCQEYIYYKDINQIVYNERLKRLEIYGLVKCKNGQKKTQKGVLLLYELFDVAHVIEAIQRQCGISLKRV